MAEIVCNFKSFTEQELREMARKFYDFIVNNLKFSINQNKIEFNCDTIEYAALTHDGIILLDSFSVPVSVYDFYFAFKAYADDENTCKKRRSELLILFKDYLENRWIA